MELYIDHASKQFKDKLAVNDVTLNMTPGVWGLLGANGAGKTTLMRMIAGILTPTSGEILYDGIPISTLKGSYRGIFGYLPQEFGFYPEFTVQDHLEYIAALKGLDRKKAKEKIDDLLQRVGLADVRRKKIANLSGGMKRRAGIAQALLNDPDILVLDEPTSGLDPAERVRFRNILSEFAKDRIVLISTHIVSDVEYIASQNAIMKNGEIHSVGTTEELLKQVDGKVWSCTIPNELVGQYEKELIVVNLRNESGSLVSMRYLADSPRVPDSSPEEPHLEDLYLWLFPQQEEKEDK